MGADGSLYLMRADVFAAEWPGVTPEQCGLREATVLGVPAVCAYSDTEGRDDFEYSIASKWERLTWRRNQMKRLEADGKGKPGERSVVFERRPGGWSLPAIVETEVLADIALLEDDPEIEVSKRVFDAIDWFEKHAEAIVVWT